MSKTTLYKKIHKELEKLNDKIDAKIIKGLRYDKEARRHRDLLATLQRINSETGPVLRVTGRRSCFGKSPVRSTFKKGAIARLFERRLAY